MKKVLFLLLVTSALNWSTATAAVSDEEFSELRRQLAAVSQRLDALEMENAELRRSHSQTETAIVDVQTSVTEVRQASSGGEAWTDRVGLSGDFRYRYEDIDVDGSPSRDRNRIRARANVKAEPSDDVEVGFGLATGGDDPVSTNQTLGAGGSSKSIILNLAYADWQASDGVNLIFGKYKNPLHKSGKAALLWDGDWTPEGVAVKFQRDQFFVNAIGTFLESDSKNSNDNFSWGLQVGLNATLGEVKFKGGAAYYSFGTAGNATNFGDVADPGDYFGNTAVEASGLACGTTGADCTYLYDYDLTELFAEASFRVGEWPATVYADYVTNGDPSDNDTAWLVGTRFGQAKNTGDFELNYYYADKEADSMVGLLTDSDFGGGGTDSKGHFLQVNYGVNKSWVIGAQYFINETDVASGGNTDYNRLMIDSQWKWK